MGGQFSGEKVVSFQAKKTLYQNYPNPFNSSSIINYSLRVNSLITLKLYDISGKEIRTLINERKPQGNYTIKFDGNGLSSGIYFYSLFINGLREETKRMILLK